MSQYTIINPHRHPRWHSGCTQEHYPLFWHLLLCQSTEVCSKPFRENYTLLLIIWKCQPSTPSCSCLMMGTFDGKSQRMTGSSMSTSTLMQIAVELQTLQVLASKFVYMPFYNNLHHVIDTYPIIVDKNLRSIFFVSSHDGKKWWVTPTCSVAQAIMSLLVPSQHTCVE